MKNRLHEALQSNKDFTTEDIDSLNPTKSRSIQTALSFIQNPVKMCDRVYALIQDMNEMLRKKVDEQKTRGELLYI